jgi:hypothetical protein
MLCGVRSSLGFGETLAKLVSFESIRGAPFGDVREFRFDLACPVHPADEGLEDRMH